MKVQRIKMTGLMVPVGAGRFSNDITSGQDGVSLELTHGGLVQVHKTVEADGKVTVHTTGVPVSRLDFIVYSPEVVPVGTSREAALDASAEAKRGQHAPSPVGPGDVRTEAELHAEREAAAREGWKAAAVAYVEAHGGPPHCPTCTTPGGPPQRPAEVSADTWECYAADCSREAFTASEGVPPTAGYLPPESAPAWLREASERYRLRRKAAEASVPRTPTPPVEDTSKPSRKRAGKAKA